jgi:hypothetical protein
MRSVYRPIRPLRGARAWQASGTDDLESRGEAIRQQHLITTPSASYR